MARPRKKESWLDGYECEDSDFASHSFDSPDSVIAAVDSAVSAQKAGNPSPKWCGSWNHDRPEHGDWYGGSKSWDDMKSIARSGWPEGVAVVAKLRARADAIIERIRGKCEGVAYDVSGQWLDVGRHLSGEPEAFGSFVQMDCGAGQSKVVRVDVNLAVSGGVSSGAFLARGAAACALCDMIESSGRRCEIYAVSSSVCKRPVGRAKRGLNIRILIKGANEPLDMARVAFAMAHVGFFRRAVVSFMQSIGHDPNCAIPVPFRYSSLPPEMADFAACEDAIVVDEMHLAGVEAAGGWERFVSECLKKIGVDVEGLFDGVDGR